MVAAGGGGAFNQDTYASCYGGSGGGLTGYAGNGGTGCYAWSTSTGDTTGFYQPGTGATQTAGGVERRNNPTGGLEVRTRSSFGHSHIIDNYCSAGGGGGWYGGGRSYHVSSAGGGSSFISGHNGSNAINTSTSTESNIVHTGNATMSYNGRNYTFTSTVMIDGQGYKWTNTKGSRQQMPKPAGGSYASGVGHSGNGYARITYLGN